VYMPDFLFSFLSFFWWAWCLNSGLHAYNAGSLLLEPHLSPFLLWLFGGWGSPELFAWAGLKLQSSWSQLPK
jgi:hypothetical protein